MASAEVVQERSGTGAARTRCFKRLYVQVLVGICSGVTAACMIAVAQHDPCILARRMTDAVLSKLCGFFLFAAA